MKNEKKSSALRPEGDLAGREDDLIARSDRDAVRAALSDRVHLHVGMLFSQIMEKGVARYTAEHGDSRQDRKHVMDALYGALGKEFGRTREAVRLYIRCHQRFADSEEFSTLRLSDSNLPPRLNGDQQRSKTI
ncbi:hypothetical protein QYH69_22335 [Paraburkholderia sp. SARCC-3016]|uniref:hypothetical protein n=1 Tax=Paraburkholderia sp. SARCC-3016 TaxID=3058611 RepID=UPI00280A1042|nr:hypothetical protein [Paraburkholderia sp. SARCC-3016]MDQ7979984.1 hypothetical protein [Paraburkholderia sp. SARCC-3016]